MSEPFAFAHRALRLSGVLGEWRAYQRLVLALLFALGASAPAAPPPRKPKAKSAPFGQLASFYSATPTGYNDDLTDTDAMGMSYPGYGTAMTTVQGETRPLAYKATRVEVESHLARLGLKPAADEDLGKLPPGQIRAVADEIRALAIPPGSGGIFLCATPEALVDLCKRVTWLGDRDTGKAPQVVVQLFVLAWANSVSFGPGDVASVEIKCVPLPYGLLGPYQKDHRDTRKLAAYLASIAAGNPPGK